MRLPFVEMHGCGNDFVVLDEWGRYCAPEFRRQMVESVQAGRSPAEVAREFEVTAQSIRNWVTQAKRDAGHGDGGLTTAERRELSRLRRENRQLRL